MLLRCKPGCTGKQSNAIGKLDVKSDRVICEDCGDEMDVSSFSKRGMKACGDIRRRKKRVPYVHFCEECKLDVETILDGDKLIGKSCSKECNIPVSDYAIRVRKMTATTNRKIDSWKDE